MNTLNSEAKNPSSSLRNGSSLYSLRKYLNSTKRGKRFSQDSKMKNGKSMFKEINSSQNHELGPSLRRKTQMEKDWEEMGVLLNTMKDHLRYPLQVNCNNTTPLKEWEVRNPQNLKRVVKKRTQIENKPMVVFHNPKFTQVSSPLMGRLSLKKHRKVKVHLLAIKSWFILSHDVVCVWFNLIKFIKFRISNR